jgi:hypothetical protein
VSFCLLCLIRLHLAAARDAQCITHAFLSDQRWISPAAEAEGARDIGVILAEASQREIATRYCGIDIKTLIGDKPMLCEYDQSVV